VKVNGITPVFRNVTGRDALVVLIAWFPNARLVGATLAFGPSVTCRAFDVAVPAPLMATT
jgi:hypothetical protein